ncbi:enoyl-CoA hydratase [Paramixta manurensis]|uniref:Enoyl-CoA hydratase n=1 Tax=Paramixta manurensis TaxID=2740817 RepID=A0A6M8UCR6_9GAMM|nr:enoyl-CoA hydratase [Erwiniaceae bacterium PD-1]
MNVLQITSAGACVTLRLNRPEKRNALNKALLQAIRDALNTLRHERHLKLLIIRSAGDKAFSAGADIKEQTMFTPQQAYDHMRWGQAIFDEIEHFPLPTLAVIDGFALGGGLELALACDMRFATTRSSFGNPEITLGNHPGWGGTQRLPRLIGQSFAREIMFSGLPVSAERALQMGLVNQLFVPETLDAGVCRFAEAICQHYTPALRTLKAVTEAANHTDMERGQQLEASSVSRLWGAAAQKEAQYAFFNKT